MGNFMPRLFLHFFTCDIVFCLCNNIYPHLKIFSTECNVSAGLVGKHSVCTNCTNPLCTAGHGRYATKVYRFFKGFPVLETNLMTQVGKNSVSHSRLGLFLNGHFPSAGRVCGTFLHPMYFLRFSRTGIIWFLMNSATSSRYHISPPYLVPTQITLPTLGELLL